MWAWDSGRALPPTQPKVAPSPSAYDVPNEYLNVVWLGARDPPWPMQTQRSNHSPPRVSPDLGILKMV